MKKIVVLFIVLLFVVIFSSLSLAEERTGILTHFENLPQSVAYPEGCILVQLYDGERIEVFFFQKYQQHLSLKENEGKEITIFFQIKGDKIVLMSIECKE